MDNGEVLIANSVDTSGQQHASINMKFILKSCINVTQTKFNCVVRSVCSDDVRNMALMRRLVRSVTTFYACSAHS